MDERHFKILAGQFAAFRQAAKQPADKLIDLTKAPLNRIGLLKGIGDQRFSFQSSKWLGFQCDLHDDFIASDCDTLLVPLPCGPLWFFRPGGGPKIFCPAPARFRPWQCPRGNKSAKG